MRAVLTSLALILLQAAPGRAFEVEERLWLDGAAPVATVSILSTTDSVTARPLLQAFLADNPDLSVDYVVASALQIHRAIAEEGASFDLVISSAMDLQVKLANDGYALQMTPEAAETLPHWAHWRDLVYGFALEPVVIVVAAGAFPGRLPPRTRRDLIELLREEPDRFRGRIGTYDPGVSGSGYLFATQDAGLGNTFWRLAEVMGRLDAQLYCCSGDMLRDLDEGRILLAYNVVASYALAQANRDRGFTVIEPEDFTLMLIRSALVPATSKRPALGAKVLAFLLSDRGQALMSQTPGTYAVTAPLASLPPSSRPIRLDPGLLANLDTVRRRAFLGEWAAAMTQP
ncbi:ABC transporter substrate-binding protein [Xinfangfangia pollutisoli]|uniref:ABC transporter substrate-binding protein n=1 Tax=Xinfangfangia pollutisoli TaxID=2865960 RepID=UPI001CD305DF|nr:ABC transporter substrate-binding protein [Xinfangfangia pollutisoli]